MNMQLTVSNITKIYDSIRILSECSFSFEKSGIYGITGPNGSGKSTFLRICSLLETPDEGKVVYLSDGRSLTNDISLRRRITLVLPGVGVFNATVMKNVLYGLHIRGQKGKDAEERGTVALEFVGLHNKKNQNALTLSSGEKQRLGLARALVIQPDIVFLDEPTASVDRKNTAMIEDMIIRLKNNNGITVVITTHDAAQAKRLSDYSLVMDSGHLSPE
jgi:tungstate transport system ATP-binding protein